MHSNGDSVQHTKFGTGLVLMDDGQTVVVQFEHGLERCLPAELTQVETPLQALRRQEWDSPLTVVARVLAEAIQSVNDRWGVFSRSRIALLPHQLWVCRKVLESWPTRWLVADDVGLGKTIEAGLILWPVLTRETVRRLLILCPASLVDQWQNRMRTMFDIRLARYVSPADTEKSDFWHTHPQIVVSLQTLRQDANDRHKRLLEAPPWDLVIVDEAHHLNSDDKSGPTLGYSLVERLNQENKIRSMIFFTGTPHRGKNFGFLSLLQLLRPDLFDPKRPLQEQLAGLRQVMIRNNKQNVTDLKGERLFEPPKVTSETYSYSDSEARFYAMVTEFITTGKAYASTLSSSDQRMVMLVLTAMQKLASSSVAAIRRALKNRLAKLRDARQELLKLQQQRELLSRYEECEEQCDNDALNIFEEQLPDRVELRLVKDEESQLEELIAAADQVGTETKIEKLLATLDAKFPGRSVLFFTEYKATQSLLMSALKQKFGDSCVTFINGDGRAEDVLSAAGKRETLVAERETAATHFTSGQVRFLVSTEAAGEGIDLQENCHTLIHVDLPWNPMRLHQRVGRLYRYGQEHRVEVLTLRNPSTVESRIWEQLNTKIDRIMEALREVMDEPEDLLELVLGMTSPHLYREVFAEAPQVPAETLSSWFDQKTARIGGQDVLDAVRSLVGHCAHFDFQQMSDRIPKLDLPALQPYFLAMLALSNRRFQESEAGISFNTPETWMKGTAMRTKYQDMVFSRTVESVEGIDRVLGVGHVLFDEALRQGRSLHASITAIPVAALPELIVVYRISERVTSTTTSIRSVLAAARFDDNGTIHALQDWELIRLLNEVLSRRTLRRDAASERATVAEDLLATVNRGREEIARRLDDVDARFLVPDIQIFAILYPRHGDAAEPSSCEPA